MENVVIKKEGSKFIVKENGQLIKCRVKGTLKTKIKVIVGDIVEIGEEETITRVFDRKNLLNRPNIANVNQALIVVSAVNPEFSTYLLDKTINIIEYNNIKPVICITKMDLLKEKEYIESLINYYTKIGYKVILNTDKKEVEDTLENKTTVLIGQSGVGKSTLLNFLDDSLNLLSQDISLRLGRGKNTTRSVELLEISNGLVADTPGFSVLDFTDMKKEDVRDNMIEFESYKTKCKYKDCMHLKERECEVKKALEKCKILESRYENYTKFIGEL